MNKFASILYGPNCTRFLVMAILSFQELRRTFAGFQGIHFQLEMFRF